jgi:hypothetical protein
MSVGSILRNIFDYNVPSDLLLLEDTKSLQIIYILVHWQQATFTLF